MARRLLKYFAWTLLAVLALVLGAVGVFTLTEAGRDRLAALISDFASSEDSALQIGGIDGIWGGRLTVEHVVMKDKRGAWLVLRDIELDWSPMALLSSTFRADRVSVRRIELARLPEASAEPSEGGGGLPVALDIARFELPDIAIGPELAGGIAGLSAKGSLIAAADLQSIGVKAAIDRTDGHAGHVEAVIDFMPAERKLDVNIVASEPKGGLIAGALGLKGEPAVDLVVSGSGPYSKWAGTGSFAIDGTVVTTVSARHSTTNRGSRVEAKGDGSFERFLPASLRPLVAGSTGFAFAGTLLSEGGVDVEIATLRSAAMTVEAKGAVDPSAGSDFTFEARATGEPVKLSFGEGPEPVVLTLKSASLRAFGPGSAPMADLQASLAEVAFPGHGFEGVEVTAHSDGFDTASMTGPVEVGVKAAAGGSVNETVASLLAGMLAANVQLDLAGDDISIRAGSFASGTAKAEFSGAADLATGAVSAKINADVASVALPQAARAPLGERVLVSATLARDAAGAMSVEGLDLSSGGLGIKGRAGLAGEAVSADLSGTIADIAPLSPGASGAVAFAVTADGPLAAPNFSLSLTADRIEAAGRAITGLDFSARGVADMAKPSATVSLKGDVGGMPLTGGAEVATEGGNRFVRNLSVALGQNRIEGDLTLDATLTPVGEIALSLPDIGPLAALALETAQGSIDGTIRFAKQGAMPALTVDAKASQVKRGDMIAEGLAISASVENYLSAPSVAGTVKATRIAAGGADIGGLDVTLTRDATWTAFSGGATVNGIPASATGRAGFETGATIIELSKADARIMGIEVALARATTVKIVEGVTTLDRLTLALGGGSVTASGTIGEALALDVQVGTMPAGIANQIVPGLGASGTISGSARIAGAAADPAIGYSIDWKGAETTQTREAGFGAMRITSSGEFKNSTLAFKASVGEGSGLGMQGGGTVALSGAPSLSLQFDGKVPFAFLTRRLAAQGFALTGASDVSLSLSGPASAPSVTGSVRTSGARLIDAGSGIAIDELAIDIGMSAGVATIRSLTGKLSSGGNISASGTIGIDVAKGFPANLELSLTDGRYTDGRLVTANLGGRLTLSGALMGTPLIAGTVDLGKTVVTVPESLPTSLSRLGVEHRNASQAVRSQDQALKPATSGGNAGGLSLDLTLNAPSQIFVQGRGLDAELGGTLRLTGSAGAPQATGQFTLRRGRLSLLGKRLDFTRGTASFAGSLVPYLDLAADSTAEGATVTILVTGNADNPKFSFSSSPSLPEDEILARLIFGRSMSNLSPLQIAQLAEAAAQLAGVGGPTSLLTTLRSKIGVDDLDVTTDEATGDAAVSAGKYLNDNTYVTVQKGEKAGSGKATIDLDVGRGVKLRGEAAEDGKAKGGIFFEREY